MQYGEQGEKEAEVIKQGTRTDLMEPSYQITKLRGTGAIYLSRAIARKAQTDTKARDVLERMKKGEFQSVYAAAKEAGVVKKLTPVEQMKRLWARLSSRQRSAFDRT